MREPAVVRIPGGQMTSFTPTGTPASGPGSSPAAIRRSIASAAARASVSLTVRNAPTCGSTAGVRGIPARTAPTEDTSRRRTRSAVSRTPRSCRALMTARLLDDSGDPDQATVACRRVGQQRLVAGRIGHLVGPQGGSEVVDVRGGRDVGRVQRLETREGVEDVIEVGREPFLLVGPEPQAGEAAAPAHLVPGDRHARFLPQGVRIRNAACPRASAVLYKRGHGIVTRLARLDRFAAGADDAR